MDYTYHHTPQTWLQRADSKNPATTCCGITATGRSCRRDLAATSPRPVLHANSKGVKTVDHEELKTLFCHQHRDQAEALGKSLQITIKPVRTQNSMESLMERLGGMRLEKSRTARQDAQAGNRHQIKHHHRPGNRPVQHAEPAKKPKPKPKPKAKEPGIFTLLCCLAGPVERDEQLEIIKRRQRKELVEKQAVRPPLQQQRSASSRLFSLIPGNLSPETTASLLAELTKPISDRDEEGYIYAFLLTEEKVQAPSEVEASSLLLQEPSHEPSSELVRSNTLKRYSRPTQGARGKKLLVKVGRASNVHRRMQQWSKQCNQNITLIRFYPYKASATSPAGRGGQTVKFSHRVERLIHLELADSQSRKGRCEFCGQQHREWFEIEASEAGLRGLDSTIKRWVGWAQRKAESGSSSAMDER